jgi:hypothetical protein
MCIHCNRTITAIQAHTPLTGMPELLQYGKFRHRNIWPDPNGITVHHTSYHQER